MAGPPPTTLSLQDRLLKLAQTLQFAWFVGHVSLLLCTLRYGLSYLTFNFNSKWATFSYRTAFVSAAATYGIVVYKSYRARVRQGKSTGLVALLADENVQYLAISFVWLFFRQVPLAILPFSVYSVFHVLTYTRANLLPAISPSPAAAPTSPGAKPKATGLSDTIGKFVKEYYDLSMGLVAALEIALWFRIFGSAIFFQKGSWILLLAYTAFFRARYAQSTFVQKAVSNITNRADASFANQSTPPAVRNAWESVKGLGRQAHDATDLTRYVGGREPAGVKKAQ
ncbi:hypothetical protein EJ08DRAFT_604569 [Tothia fuscella]|uniref:Endoplasmic reticulum protein n=1 Tax=Tothia fuscella TaxID=1048955 RepID=A0A9P4P192_9PEZI|nr:hypothetical protein EJ08DRAFT_604569 [Tothia fuscella]